MRFCPGRGAGWQALRASTSTGQDVQAAALGRGPAVVFANESDDDQCAWMGLARRVAARGHRVAVFRYGATDDESRLVETTLAVARAAGGPAAVVGASIGGRVAFQAAAAAPRVVTAVVSVSGERQVTGFRDLVPVVRRVRARTLYLGSREDPYTDGTRQPRQLQAALRARDARFLLVAGAEHGVALLNGSMGADLERRLQAFLGGRGA